MKRQVQTIEKMTEELKESKKHSNKLYKAQSDEYKEGALSMQIEHKIAMLDAMQLRGRVNLRDVEEVKLAVSNYLEACKLAAAFPTLAGLATSMGYSRQHIYKWLSSNPGTPTAEYLELTRSIFADVLTQAGLKKNCDTILSIFLLKNSGQGFTDKQELQIEPVIEERRLTAEEIAMKYQDLGYLDD